MLGFNRWHLITVSAATLCSAGIAWLALAYFIPAPPSTISMAVGGEGGSYELLAARYKEILARTRGVRISLRCWWFGAFRATAGSEFRR
jgi:TRAP-type uncharacterized transport system substrate-binding protein